MIHLSYVYYEDDFLIYPVLPWPTVWNSRHPSHDTPSDIGVFIRHWLSVWIRGIIGCCAVRALSNTIFLLC